jgi:voltage-gated potassium channel
MPGSNSPRDGRRLERRLAARLTSLTLRSALSLIAGLATLLAGAAALLEWALDPAFTSFRDALWFSVVTVTTVGYGDYVPESTTGRFVAGALMLAGVSIIPLVTSVVVATLVAQRTREERENDLRQLDMILERLDSIEGKLPG